jgi:hypothetical protein
LVQLSKFAATIVLVVLTAGGASVCFSASWEDVRAQEIAQCQQGEIETWHDSVDRPAVASPLRFVYNHTSAPSWFDETTVLAAVQQAAKAWSTCGIPMSVAEIQGGGTVPAGSISVVWSELGSRHNFGLANFGDRTISLGPSAFQLLQTRNPSYDSRQTLQMVISHEMGHLFGVMAHSKRCVDVTSYYDDGKGGHCSIRGGASLPPGVEYRSVLPTACDIQRCRAANAAEH